MAASSCHLKAISIFCLWYNADANTSNSSEFFKEPFFFFTANKWLDVISDSLLFYWFHSSSGWSIVIGSEIPSDMKKGILNLPCRTRSLSICKLVPSNGRAPQTSTYSTTPRLWKDTDSSDGATYCSSHFPVAHNTWSYASLHCKYYQ